MISNKERAQIATILTLVMAVIFLFIVITINIGTIAQEKTMVSNASDGAALLLASTLGSLANALRIKLELWGDKPNNCDIDWALIGAFFALVASLFLIWNPFGWAGLGLSVATIIGLAGSVALFGVGMWNAIVAEPGVFKQIELKFQNMTMEQRMKEKALQYALFAVVSDPNKVCRSGQFGGGDPSYPACGGCSDPEDIDMDGDTTDCVLWFAKWYNDRLKALPRLGEVVTYFYEKAFSRKLEGRAPRFYVWENPETWKAKIEEEPFEFVHAGFWLDTNSSSKPEPDQGSLRLEGITDDHKDPQGVVYAHDIYFVEYVLDPALNEYRFMGWLEERFKPLVRKLHQYGYGLAADLNATIKDIGSLELQIKDFSKEMIELYGATYEARLESFDEWIKIFYNGDPAKQDWYKRMDRWLTRVNSWIDILNNRKDKINNCVESCWAPGPYECGFGSGELCRSHEIACNPHDCNCGCCGEDAFGNCTGECCDTCWDKCCIHDAWCGCNPAGRRGGQLCPSGHCRPALPCTTPADGGKGGADTPCCTIAENTLYYQLCDPTTHSNGGDGPCDGPSPCTDTYYNCGFDPRNNVISREHAIEYLTQFRDDVQVLMNIFKKTYEDGQEKEKDPRFYEALYEWNDKVAKAKPGEPSEPGEQLVHHMAYIKLSDNLKPDNGFKVPYVHTEQQWFPPAKCHSVENARGDFTITVGRYDQDVGTAPRSPLKKFWIFKTRRNPSTAEVVQSGYTAPDAMPSTYQDKANFVLDNGVVAITRGHYGPGDTYTKEELKTWGTEAAKRNKDIYIERIR